MEIYELIYQNRIVKAMEKSSMYYTILPEEYFEGKGILKRIILTDGENCQIYFKNADGQPEYNLKVLLQADGIIHYEGTEIEGKQIAEYVFNNLADNSTFPYNIAEELYQVKIQLQEILNLRNKLREARKAKLNLRLKRLGYSSPQDVLEPLTDCPSYIDIYDVFEDLENYEDYIDIEGFSRRVYPDELNKADVDIVYNVPTLEVKNTVLDLIKRIERETVEGEEILFSREDLFIRKRKLIDSLGMSKPEEFGMSFRSILSMEESDLDKYLEYIAKMSKSYIDNESIEVTKPKIESVPKGTIVWQKYVTGLNALARVYLGLNKDLLDFDGGLEDFTGLYGKKSDGHEAGEELKAWLDWLLSAEQLEIPVCAENIACLMMNLDFLRMFDDIIAKNDSDIPSTIRETMDMLKEDSLKILTERYEHVKYQIEAKRLFKEGGIGQWPGHKPRKKSEYPNFDDDGVGGNR